MESIQELERRINQLKLSTARSVNNLQTEVDRLRKITIAESSKEVWVENDTGSVTGTVIINKPATISSDFIIHKDRYGNEILPGNKVKFLSSGAFDSTEGIVKSADKTWIRSIDYKGRVIKRAPRNLRVVI